MKSSRGFHAHRTVNPCRHHWDLIGDRRAQLSSGSTVHQSQRLVWGYEGVGNRARDVRH